MKASTKTRRKHKEVIEYLEKHDGIIDWVECEIDQEKLSAAINDGIVQSFCETETYMLMIEEGRNE